MLDFRLNAERILAQVQKGQRMILTRRGKPVARLEPVAADQPGDDDPIYRLGELADWGTPAESLTNEQMDRLIYGS